MPSVDNLTFQYLPSIIEMSFNTSKWINGTNGKWIDKNYFEFTNLKPYTEYNMTVYVRVVGSSNKDGYKPTQYLTARTSEAGLFIIIRHALKKYFAEQ